jgi:phosphopantetheine--protein transferase-like protein
LTSIGNDIVDLTSPDSVGKSLDRRFIARVFTPEEQERIDRSLSPDATLWMLWAAKEAAFKAVSKFKPGLSFAHRAYAHRDEPGKAAHIVLKQTNGNAVSIQECGVVMTPAGPVDTFFTLSTHRVHCVAAVRNGNGGAPAANPVHVLEERRDGPFDPSAAVRRAAIHHLASVTKASPYYIDIRRDETPHGYGAPRVFIEGNRTDIDISLSHDGKYIAFAVHY